MRNNPYTILRAISAVASSLALTLAAISANAAAISDPGDLTPGATIITFDEFTVGTLEPLSSGIATITSTSGNQRVQAQGFPQHPGIYEGQYFGFAVTTYIIEFSRPVQEFGMGIFDPNFNLTNLAAYDSSNNLLEMLTPDLGPPGGSHSDFAGFVRNSADISRIVLTPEAGDLLGIDNVSYNFGVVPLPAALPLFAGAIGLMSLLGWRRRG